MEYKLLRYGSNIEAKRFRSRRSLCSYLRNLDLPALKIEETFCLLGSDRERNVHQVFYLEAYGSGFSHLRAIPL